MHREPWVAPAGAPGVMNHLGGRLEHDRRAARAQAVAEVDVLVVEEIGFVETADRAVSVAAQQHEHARHPVRFLRPALGCVVGFPAIRVDFLQQAARGGKSPRAVFNPTRRAAHQGACCGDPRLAERPQQGRKRIRGQANVGIADAEERRAAALEGGVVIGAEAFAFPIDDDFNRAGKIPHGEVDRIGNVLREDQRHAVSARAPHVIQQRVDERVLAVADDRERDLAPGHRQLRL